MSSTSTELRSAFAYDVTVVVAAQRAGPLLAQALRSVREAVAAAGEELRCEVLIVVDRSDDGTRAVADMLIDTERLLVADAQDLAAAHNVGVENARGLTLTRLQGDEMFGRLWLSRGFDAVAQEQFGEICVHPEATVSFGERKTVLRHFGMDRPDFKRETMMFENGFPSLSLAPLEVYRRTPFRSPARPAGFGHEHWAWINETTHTGVRHVVAPETVHVVRSRRALRAVGAEEDHYLPVSTPLFSGGVMS